MQIQLGEGLLPTRLARLVLDLKRTKRILGESFSNQDLEISSTIRLYILVWNNIIITVQNGLNRERLLSLYFECHPPSHCHCQCCAAKVIVIDIGKVNALSLSNLNEIWRSLSVRKNPARHQIKTQLVFFLFCSFLINGTLKRALL